MTGLDVSCKVEISVADSHLFFCSGSRTRWKLRKTSFTATVATDVLAELVTQSGCLDQLVLRKGHLKLKLYVANLLRILCVRSMT